MNSAIVFLVIGYIISTMSLVMLFKSEIVKIPKPIRWLCILLWPILLPITAFVYIISSFKDVWNILND